MNSNHARFTISKPSWYADGKTEDTHSGEGPGQLGYVHREKRRHIVIDRCLLMDDWINEAMGKHLPTEVEWEMAAQAVDADPAAGRFFDNDILHPTAPGSAQGGLHQLLGDVWEWTGSAYRPHPGFRAAPGAVGEYNGKFMSGQFVLKGGSCATPRGHMRASYRNFFYPHQRWQFTGLRLAKDL